ncbi:MAG TPA: hypothetical protein ENN28_04185 [Candidatus Uhrbacteria bacterium]|nr:hypothetical protein [Candidatus Uhrbacteria bacterium]
MFELKDFLENLRTIKDVFDKKKKAKKERKKLIVILTIFFVFLIIFIFIAAPVFAYQLIYQDKIYPGVYIDGVNLGGLTQEEAINRLNQSVDNLKLRGLNFRYQNKSIQVEMTTFSPIDPDLAYQILSFEVEKMAEQAYNFGRQENFFANLSKQIKAILVQQEIPLFYRLNEKELANILEENLADLQKPAQNAGLVFAEGDRIEIVNEVNGFVIDYEQAIEDLKEDINLVAIKTVELKTRPSFAKVTRIEAVASLPLVRDFLDLEKIILKNADHEWVVEKDEFKNWLVFEKEENQIVLVFANEFLFKKLEELAEEINQPAKDAKFSFQDGKVTEFQPSKPGLALDLESSSLKINEEFFNNKNTAIDLVVKGSEPKVKTGDVNNWGIKELIGSGVTDYAGSSSNRVKNIKNAVSHLNGMLIEPESEFSLVQALGEINAAAGYVPEYVIKGDRTIPEYGGGLCQIATTVFRAALHSGSPITERKPHSYIVSYYKPIGMDATIYGPHPDLRFINDTGHYILIQARTEGTILTFDFWGAGDGRKVEITEPVLYNWKAQPADRLIENPALKPGAKKLMEKGRRGVDAYFYRYLTLANGEQKEEIWRSHYIPWPNIYEIGVEPPKPEEPADDGEDDGESVAED